MYFDPDSDIAWDSYFLSQAGNGYYKGQLYQRGHGLGNVFKGLFKFLAPIAKSVGKSVGKQALTTGLDIAQDLVEGKSIKEAAKQRLKEGIAAQVIKARQSQEGKGLKRKLIKGRVEKKKKAQLGVLKRKKDIFKNA